MDMWQSWVEIEHYSIVYAFFNMIIMTELFDALLVAGETVSEEDRVD